MANEKTIYELANETVKKIGGKNIKDIRPNQTGMTYMLNSKDRLCKVVLTKKALKLECNIELSEKLITELKDVKGIDITAIDKETAKKKKLGTMKHLVIAIDNSWTEKIIKDMLETHNPTKK